jgi:hypothetical protein
MARETGPFKARGLEPTAEINEPICRLRRSNAGVYLKLVLGLPTSLLPVTSFFWRVLRPLGRHPNQQGRSAADMLQRKEISSRSHKKLFLRGDNRLRIKEPGVGQLKTYVH